MTPPRELKDKELDATGLLVPPEVIAALDSGKKPKVKVTLNGYTYRSTVAVMGGLFMLPLAMEHRNAAGVKAGDKVQVTLDGPAGLYTFAAELEQEALPQVPSPDSRRLEALDQPQQPSAPGEGASHAVHTDAPVRLVEEIERFLLE